MQRLAILTYTYCRGVSSSHGAQTHFARRTGMKGALEKTSYEVLVMVPAYPMGLVEHVRPPRLDLRNAEIEVISNK